MPHLYLIDLETFRMPRIHIVCWTMFLTYSVPSCWLCLCSFRKINSPCDVSDVVIGCFELKFNGLLPVLFLARISPSLSKVGDNCRILQLFGISFSALRDFSSSPNCSRCSNLKMIAFNFSLSSTLTTIVAGFCLLSYRCTYVSVFTIQLMLRIRAHWIAALFFSLYYEGW